MQIDVCFEILLFLPDTSSLRLRRSGSRSPDRRNKSTLPPTYKYHNLHAPVKIPPAQSWMPQHEAIHHSQNLQPYQ